MSERNIFEGIGGTVEFEIENTNELKELFNKTKEESLKIRKRFTDGTYTEDDLLNHLPRFGLGTEDKIEMYVVESKYFEDLANRYTNLKEIEQEHKKENEELREKVKKLEEENTVLKRANNISEDVKIEDITKFINKSIEDFNKEYIPVAKIKEKIVELDTMIEKINRGELQKYTVSEIFTFQAIYEKLLEGK